MTEGENQVTTNKRLKITPAIARLEAPLKPKRNERLRRDRQIKAWKRKAEETQK